MRLPVSFTLAAVLVVVLLVACESGAAQASNLQLQAEALNFDWSRGKSSPFKHTEAQGGVINDQLYIVGGYTSWEPFCSSTSVHRYTPDTNNWEKLSDAPMAFTHAGVVVEGALLHFAGAYDNQPNCTIEEQASRTIWTYDTENDSWTTPLPPLPEARAAGAFVRLGDSLHFVGGTDSERVDKGDHWQLLGGVWQARAPLPNPRNHPGFAVLNNELYYIGGQHCYAGCADLLRDVHKYSPVTDSWTKLADLPVPLSHTAMSTLVMNDLIVSVAGRITFNHHIKEIYAFDPATNTWSLIGALPQTRSSGVAGIIDQKLYYAGGKNHTDTLFIANVTGLHTTPIAPKPQPEDPQAPVVDTSVKVLGLMLINAKTDEEIRPLTENDSISYARLGTDQVSIRASVSAETRSVVFEIDGVPVIAEDFRPFTAGGDRRAQPRDYLALDPVLSPGQHTLIVVPYGAHYQAARMGVAMTLNFKVE